MCLDIYSIQPCVSKNWNNIHKTKDLETLTGGEKNANTKFEGKLKTKQK